MITLDQLIKDINNLTEESYSMSELIGFVNDAIAYINVETDANFPFYSDSDSSFDHPIPDKWKRLLFIPFASGRVKQKDSSQFEYTDSYREFSDNLSMFKTKYEVHEEYKDASSQSSYELDVNESVWAWGAPLTSKGPLDE